MEASTKQGATGRIEEIQGVVIEAVFPDRLPEINSAIAMSASTIIVKLRARLPISAADSAAHSNRLAADDHALAKID